MDHQKEADARIVIDGLLRKAGWDPAEFERTWTNAEGTLRRGHHEIVTELEKLLKEIE